MNFKELLIKERGSVNKRIELFLEKKRFEDEFIDGAYRIVKEQIQAGGKRIRPISMVVSYKALKGDGDIYLPAIGVELLHNSTLCHDDIMDEDSTRRNIPSCYKAFQNVFLDRFKEKNYQGDIFSTVSSRFGVSNAIIMGNVFSHIVYECISKSDFNERVKKEAIVRSKELITEINHGQMLDILYENKEGITEKEYLDMIGKKTAFLLGGSFELGAIFAEASKEVKEALFNYGYNMGIAFQIIDDIMDIDENMKKGHELGSDIKKGKRTIIVIKAFEKCSEKEKELINTVISKGDCSDTEIKKVIGVLKEKGVIEYAKNIAIKRADYAKRIIANLKGSLNKEYIDFFNSFADYVIERKI